MHILARTPQPAKSVAHFDDAHVSQYLKEEIAAEAGSAPARLPAYADFLALAALSDGDVVNYTTIARDTGTSSQTVRGYFEILEDMLLGRFLPAYRRRPKRRVVAAPKFYFGDVGVVNFLARRGALQPGGEPFGKAFENSIARWRQRRSAGCASITPRGCVR